jgi:hypothetical protein
LDHFLCLVFSAAFTACGKAQCVGTPHEQPLHEAQAEAGLQQQAQVAIEFFQLLSPLLSTFQQACTLL